MVRSLLDKPICPACLALGDEVGDLGSSPSWADNLFLLLRFVMDVTYVAIPEGTLQPDYSLIYSGWAS